MKVRQIIEILEGLAPLAHAEDFDNTGLLVGRPDAEVSGILVTLDSTEDVVQEAVEVGADLIVSFHPIVFSGLTHLTGSDYVQRVVMDAIRADIAIFSMHTALDNASRGVSDRMAEAIGLNDRKVLIPRTEQLLKLITYVPEEALEAVRRALFDAGAGELGNYRECGFELVGQGGFLPLDDARPAIGVRGQRFTGPEVQLHVVLDRSREREVVHALKHSHPYEEVAYEVYALRNERSDLGMGSFGDLPEPMKEEHFVGLLKKTFGTPTVRHSRFLRQDIRKVALLGGSGSFAIRAAISAGCQALVTADLKYHQFFQAEGKILLIDIGHYEGEQFTKNIICEYLTEKIPNFAVTLSRTLTNPVFYS